ncbi:Rpn family recombination-promoting nuclease/putative transposase [Parabacteroides pacaensis]|uniref:Rpn family recombination-promoting nuclease/putative transposase n=1 Tax=Parabacteroides pacaensis TaxID=2086575 RepID=UPI0021D29071|nr:Rpn family recombination-promoting nuclease/putative transposase [Parabacteroides pacaensis]
MFLCLCVDFLNISYGHSLLYKTDFERWLYVLTRMETLERMPWEAQKATFQKLMKEANIANMTPEEREKYDAELDAYTVMENALKHSKKEGMKKTQLQIARNLKDLGIPSQIIAQSTGFSLEEVEKL